MQILVCENYNKFISAIDIIQLYVCFDYASDNL